MNPFSLFLINDSRNIKSTKFYKIDNFWLTFIILLIFGFFYGICINPVESEIVEFAQIWAGKIKYIEINSWYSGRLKEVTLQAIIPAYLLKLGFSESFLVLLSSGFATAIAFSAVGMTGFLLTRMPLAALSIPFILINYLFYNAHFYGVVFPINFFVFGNLGMYFALLTIILFLFEKRIMAFFLIGFLPGIHIPWSLAVWIGIFIITLINRKVVFNKGNVISFVFGLLTFVLILFSSYIFLIPDAGPIKNPYIKNAKVIEKNIEKTFSTSQNTDKTIETKNQKFLANNRINNIHNPLLRNYPDPLKAFLAFFSYDILLLLFILIFFFIAKDFFDVKLKQYIYILLTISILVVIYKFIDELFIGYNFLKPIHKSLPDFIERFLFNRWLNLNTITLLCFSISIYIYFAIIKKSSLSTVLISLLLIFVLLIETDIIPYHFKADGSTRVLRIYVFIIFNLVIFIGGFLLAFTNRKVVFNENTYSKINYNIILAFIFIMSAILIKNAVYTNLINKDPNNILFEKAKKIKGGIILAPYIHGQDNGYNVQIRTSRAIYKTNFRINNPNNKIELYCEKKKQLFTNSADFETRNDNAVKSCFENRSIDEWKYIAYSLNATNILTKSYYKLKLPVIIKNKDFTLYDIPLDSPLK